MSRERPSPIVARMKNNSIVEWVRRHPILAFLLWFFPVAWTVALIPWIAKNSAGIDVPQDPFFALATLFGSTISVIAIVRITGEPSGLGRQLVKVKAHVGWYALGLVAIPVVSLGLAALMFGLPDVTPATWVNAFVLGFGLQTVVGFAATNLWEEFAWMGFFQTRMQSRYGVFAAVLITSVFFTLQHAPLIVIEDLPVFAMLVLFVMVVPFRALIAWVYNRTGSLLLVGLLHAAGDAMVGGSITGVGLLPRLYEGQNVALIGDLAQVLIGLVVLAVTRARLGMPTRPATRVSPQAAAA
jgi:CAAX protease family protein